MGQEKTGGKVSPRTRVLLATVLSCMVYTGQPLSKCVSQRQLTHDGNMLARATNRLFKGPTVLITVPLFLLNPLNGSIHITIG